MSSRKMFCSDIRRAESPELWNLELRRSRFRARMERRNRRSTRPVEVAGQGEGSTGMAPALQAAALQRSRAWRRARPSGPCRPRCPNGRSRKARATWMPDRHPGSIRRLSVWEEDRSQSAEQYLETLRGQDFRTPRSPVEARMERRKWRLSRYLEGAGLGARSLESEFAAGDVCLRQGGASNRARPPGPCRPRCPTPRCPRKRATGTPDRHPGPTPKSSFEEETRSRSAAE